MSKNFNTLPPDSRLGAKEKKRKANKFYNIAITLVVVLIVIVGLSIFLGDKSDKATPSEKTPKETNTAATDDNKEKDKAESEKEAKAKEKEVEEKAAEEKAAMEKEADDSKTEEEAKLTEIEETDDANVEKAYTSEDWEPVGTEQSGEHVTSFDKGSADWNEMTAALASSTGIDQSSMTIWRLGNGGAPNKATGTVSSKNDDKTYRVQLEWVDGSGWQAAKIEELKTNDQN